MRTLALLALSLVTGIALAQAPKPAAKEEAAEPKAAARPRLNLKLDNPSQYATQLPREKPAEGLPTLGADARPLPQPESLTERPNNPFPKDSQRGER